MGIVRLILNLIFGAAKTGSLYVSNGSQEIFVKTRWTPSDVFINLGNSCGSTGCANESDCFDVKIVRHGFVITSCVKSKRRKIKWLAIA